MPRYFTNPDGFLDSSAFIVWENSECFSVSFLGKKKKIVNRDIYECIRMVEGGFWKELTEQEAFAMIEKKEPEKETGYAIAGRLTNGVSWNDSELGLVIDCMKSVIDFLEARGKSQDAVFTLKLQLDSFEEMKRSREKVIRIT